MSVTVTEIVEGITVVETVENIEITENVSSVTVAESGTQGPKGIQGATGSQGPQGDPGEGVPVGGTTGQVLKKIDGTDYNTEWDDESGGGGTPGGSDTQVQYNDGGSFAGDVEMVWDKTTKSFNIQSTLKQHPLHVNSDTGTTIGDVVTGSISQISETLDASPTGIVTVVPEFASPSGSSVSQNFAGSGFIASLQTFDYNIHAVLFTGTEYILSNYFEAISITDTANDSSPISNIITFPTMAANQTHWLIERQVDGGGFSNSIIVAGGTYEDSNFSGSAISTAWPSQYVLSYVTPINPTGGMSGSWNTSYFGFISDGSTFQYEVRIYVNINGTPYSDDVNSADTGSFSDPNDASSGAADASWSAGTGDGYIVRFTKDSGSSWFYFNASSSTSFIWDAQASETASEDTWNRGISGFTGATYQFKCYGKTFAPSGSGSVYSSSATTYAATIATPNIGHLFIHNFTGMPAAGGKILADYGISITNGKSVSASTFYDLGYSLWTDGITLTPSHYGFTGTAQVREYKLYGYSGSLLIYSSSPLILSTSDTGGYKYVSGSFSFPSGVTTVKITRGINGASHDASKTFSSPTVNFSDDALDSSWSGSTTVSPTTAVPSTSRHDLSRPLEGQSTDNILVIDTTGSGTRYPSIAFGIAPDSDSPVSSITSRMCSQSTTGYMFLGAPRLSGFTTTAMSTESYRFGDSNQINMQKSSSGHTTIWGADATYPIAYYYAQGDSNRGTAYFGQNSSSFGTGSKVCIAPSAGGTVGLHFRRTSGFTGNNILIDEAGSFIAGWGQSGRMFLNSSTLSTTTFLLIGGVSSGSQIRLGASSVSPSVEGDVWNDGTQKCLSVFMNAVRQFDTRTLFTQTASGTCANTTAETTISSTGVGTLVLPAGFFVAGKTLKIKAYGIHSSVSNPNLTIKIKLGSTVVCTTGAHAMHNGTNHGIEIDAMITCRSTGGSGTVFAQGSVHDLTERISMANTAATTINTGSSQTLTITAQWGTASASNTITLTNLAVEVLA